VPPVQDEVLAPPGGLAPDDDRAAVRLVHHDGDVIPGRRADRGRRKVERPGFDNPRRLINRPKNADEVDAAMQRGEGCQPASCLLELPLAPWGVSAARVVPGDCDMDETLEEVLLFRLGRAPGLLELLVRLEVLAAPNQIETVSQPLVHKAECYARRVVATILLEGVDLFIRGKLEASLQGHHLVTSDSVDPPDLVIADVGRTDPDEVADAYPDVPILGFSNHKDTAGLRRAHAAGFDRVVAKSALTERAPQLVEELTA
jgi:hypothetical protein